MRETIALCHRTQSARQSHMHVPLTKPSAHVTSSKTNTKTPKLIGFLDFPFDFVAFAWMFGLISSMFLVSLMRWRGCSVVGAALLRRGGARGKRTAELRETT